MGPRKKISLIGAVAVVTAALAGGLFTFMASGSPAATTQTTDHALFDQSSGDTGAICKDKVRSGPFEFFGSVHALGADGVLRITFQDGDFIDYAIPANTSFSLQQAAGDTAGVDKKLTVGSAPGSGQLAGWVSAEGLNGGSVSCTTTTS